MTKKNLASNLLALIFGVFAFYSFANTNFPEAYENWDNPEIESFFSSISNKKVYLDGVRAYFVQRSSPTLHIFYDLNTRLRLPENIVGLCEIRICFKPDYWVISKFEKSDDVFNNLKPYFGAIKLENGNTFIANELKISCPDSAAYNCRELKMNK